MGELEPATNGDTPRNRVIGLCAVLLACNLLVWIAALLLFRQRPILLGTAPLAYGFGLRHAVDADHIAAIDNVTRKLMQRGQRPVAVGLFFSLGHSTIVFALSAAVAGTALFVRGQFGAFERFGDIAGTLISAGFLVAIAAINIVVLIPVIQTVRRVKAGGAYRDDDLNLLLAQRGLFARLFRGLFRLVNASWQMYPIGVLFGLGFDTASEIGLLGLSATAASKGLPVWSIMLFPALFAAGMSLIDTIDGVLMLGAYGWAFAKPLRKLYYNITITSVSVAVALGIGGLETLGLAQSEFLLPGPFWNTIAALNNNFGVLGYVIIGFFIAAWIVSITIYKLRRYDEVEAK